MYHSLYLCYHFRGPGPIFVRIPKCFDRIPKCFRFPVETMTWKITNQVPGTQKVFFFNWNHTFFYYRIVMNVENHDFLTVFALKIMMKNDFKVFFASIFWYISLSFFVAMHQEIALKVLWATLEQLTLDSSACSDL